MLKKSKNVNNQVQTIKVDVTGLETLSEQIVELVEVTKLTDEEILQKYKYITWRELSSMLTRYFEKRFHLALGSRLTIGLFARYTLYSLDEPIGKALEQSLQIKRCRQYAQEQ